jgi:2,4-dienoyl-CoA reductase-like NADH-dependent reductase (Old Yellow Enzyme family)
MNGSVTTEPKATAASASASLFTPYAIHDLRLKNRIVMSPMTRSFSPGGVPTEEVAAYYRRRAENEVGLIISEGTVVGHSASANDVNVPRFYGDDALQAWQKVLHGVHAAGGRMIPQLWHVGSVRKPAESPNPASPSISPSGLRKPGVKHGEPLTQAEITEVIDAFARGAAHAMQLGFDGVELHGAHGYLIDQFLWAEMNQRDDAYGGDMPRRTQFAIEIVRACRRATSPKFPIFFRISQWKVQDYTAKLASSPEELERLLDPLVDAGVDVFHCSTRRFWEPAFEGSHLNLAGWAKKLSGKTVITVGSVGLDSDMNAAFRGKDSAVQSIDKLAEMVARGEVDLVAVGRALLGDPEWARKIRENRLDELRPFEAASMKTLY